MLFDPAKKIEPLPATAQIPLPESDRVVPSARFGPDQKPHAAMEAMPLGPRTAEPSIREDQRTLPAVNGANPPSAPANPVVPIDATKLMVVDDGSVESAFSLSSLDASKAGPLITTHPPDVCKPTPTFTPATAQQLAIAVHKTQDGVTSLVLNPEELGRVRLAITTQDEIMAFTITTERAETQDLMRRHIDMLAQEMKELGYQNVGFSFEGRGGGDHESQSTPERIIE
jgi:flagellar hook-length control protein FliK